MLLVSQTGAEYTPIYLGSYVFRSEGPDVQSFEKTFNRSQIEYAEEYWPNTGCIVTMTNNSAIVGSNYTLIITWKGMDIRSSPDEYNLNETIDHHKNFEKSIEIDFVAFYALPFNSSTDPFDYDYPEFLFIIYYFGDGPSYLSLEFWTLEPDMNLGLASDSPISNIWIIGLIIPLIKKKKI